MKRSLRLLILIIAVLFVALGAAVALDPAARIQGWICGEPFYQGRSATAWQRDLRNKEEPPRAAAISTLVAAKGDAVPVCIWLLQNAPESEVRVRAADILFQMKKDAAPAGTALVQALGDPDGFVREASIKAIGALAPDVQDAVPVLIKLFPKDLAIRTVSNFKQSGAKAVPALIPLLSHEDPVIRWNAGRTLGKIGELSVTAIPGLIKQMQDDKEPLVREHAAEALGDIGPKAAEHDPAVVPALAKALKDSDQGVRRDAVRSLGQIGPAAKPVLEDVKALLKDPEQRVVAAAEKSVRQIDAKPK